ncbi:MAG: BatD family protein [Fibrobacterota bacterium]
MKRGVILLVCMCAAAWSQETSITLTTEKNRVSPDERVFVKAEFIAEDDELSAIPRFEEGKNFTSSVENIRNYFFSRQNVINGEKTSVSGIKYDIVYEISFDSTGEISLPPLSFTHQGRKYTSNSITFTVSDEALKEQKPISIDFIRQKKSLYTGEDDLVRLRISWPRKEAVMVSNEGLRKFVVGIMDTIPPSCNIQPILNSHIEGEERLINGIPHMVIEIPFRITPFEAGTMRIPSLPFIYYERQETNSRSRRSFFSGFHESRNVKKQISSPQLTYEVRDIPPPPEKYTGAMRKVSISAFVDDSLKENGVAAGSGFDLTIGLKGEVIPSALRDFTIDSIPGARVFSPERTIRKDTVNGKIFTNMHLEYAVIPRHKGTLTIPSFEFVWFDTENHSYVTEKTSPFEVTVLPGKQQENQRVITDNKNFQQQDDIGVIRFSPGKNTLLSPQMKYVGIRLFAAVWIIVFFLILIKIFLVSSFSRFILMHTPWTYKKTVKELNKCKKRESRESPVFITEKYLGHRFSASVSSMNRSQLQSFLKEKEVPDSVVKYLSDSLDAIEKIRYAGGSETNQTENIESIISCLSHIEGMRKK